MTGSGWVATIRRGQALLELRRFEQAVEAFRESVALEPEEPDGHRLLAHALLVSGRKDEAIEPATRAVALSPDDPLSHLTLGFAYAGTRHRAKTREAAEAAVRLAPDNVDVLADAASLVFPLAPKDAERFAKRALELDPSHSSARMTRGLIELRKFGGAERARDHFRSVLQTDPQNVDALNNLGIALQRLGWEDEAQQKFERALEIAPRFATAKKNIEGTVEKRSNRIFLVLLFAWALAGTALNSILSEVGMSEDGSAIVSVAGVSVAAVIVGIRLFRTRKNEVSKTTRAVMTERQRSSATLLDALLALGGLITALFAVIAAFDVLTDPFSRRDPSAWMALGIAGGLTVGCFWAIVHRHKRRTRIFVG